GRITITIKIKSERSRGARRRRLTFNLPFRFGNQIVIRVADHLDPREFAERQFTPYVNAAVNIGSVRRAASDQEFARSEFRVLSSELPNQAVLPRTDVRSLELARGRFPFHQHFDRATDEGF